MDVAVTESPGQIHYAYNGLDCTVWEGEIDDWRLSMLFNWGMPQHEKRVKLRMNAKVFGVEFADYSIELFGVIPEQREITTLAHAFFTDDEGETITVEIWLRRVRWKNSKAAYEEAWNRVDGWQMHICYLQFEEIAERVTIANQLAKGMRLGLATTESLSTRPMGRKPEHNEQQFYEDGCEAARRLARGGNKLSDPNLGKLLRVHRNSVATYRKQYPQVWESIKRTYTEEKKKQLSAV
jgi:hypothetical protein